MGMHRKLGRPTSHRVAMLRNLTASLLTNGKIVTTETRAKELRKFEEIAPKYAERNGGYTRIMKLGPRRGDAAEMVIIELV